MWDTPFEEEMLVYENGVVINCPTEELERELARILDVYGIAYRGGVKASTQTSVWDRFGEDFCYFVRGNDLFRGEKGDADIFSWGESIRCTFNEATQREEVSDADFEAIISVC